MKTLNALIALLLLPVSAQANTGNGHSSLNTPATGEGERHAANGVRVRLAEAATTTFNLPAQPLVAALKAFAEQADMQLLYKHNVVQSATANPVIGTYEKHEALKKLLEGTNLEIIFTKDNAATIRPYKNIAGTSLSRDGRRIEGEGPLRLAQSEGQSPNASVPVGTDSNKDEQSESSKDRDSDSQGSSAKLEEIVVTAQKRKERLNEVPISISVLGGEQLDSARGSGLLEALSAAPGVTIRENFQGSMTTLGIRGVTANLPFINGSSPIGFYVDSLPFGLVRSAAVPDLNPYDLDRVEVLRGPQGTLYGASSLNGVVRVLTKDPDLDAFDLKGRTSGSSTQEGGTNYRADAAINVPLIEGKLAARAVVGYEDLSGWIDTPNREDVNHAAASNYRLKVKTQPTEGLSISLAAWHSQTHLGAASISDDEFHRVSDVKEPNDTGFDTYNVTVSYELPIVTVSSTTSYLRYTNKSVVSLDAVFPGLPLFDTDLKGKTFSQELLFNSNTQGPWRWSAGAFYRAAEERLFEVFGGVDSADNSNSLAFFGQLTRLFMDNRLELTGGLRQFEDRVSNEDVLGPIFPTPPIYKAWNKFHKVSPKATIAWHPNSDSTLYASYGEGFRSGFTQLSNVKRLVPNFPPMGPDKLTNYEVGTKTGFGRGLIDVDAAVFYIDWRNTQQILQVQDDDSVTLFPAGVNVGKVGGMGFDLALKSRPLPGLELGINYNWNDLAFRTPIESGGEILFDKGFRPVGSAKETLGGSALYSLPVQNGWVAHFGASANYTSSLTDISLVSGVPFSLSGQPILMVRSDVSLEAPEHWTLTAFVDNLTNTRHFPATVAVPEWTTRLRPRTIGLQLEFNFR